MVGLTFFFFSEEPFAELSGIKKTGDTAAARWINSEKFTGWMLQRSALRLELAAKKHAVIYDSAFMWCHSNEVAPATELNAKTAGPVPKRELISSYQLLSVPAHFTVPVW